RTSVDADADPAQDGRDQGGGPGAAERVQHDARAGGCGRMLAAAGVAGDGRAPAESCAAVSVGCAGADLDLADGPETAPARLGVLLVLHCSHRPPPLAAFDADTRR